MRWVAVGAGCFVGGVLAVVGTCIYAMGELYEKALHSGEEEDED